jgi:hypothetical protein
MSWGDVERGYLPDRKPLWRDNLGNLIVVVTRARRAGGLSGQKVGHADLRIASMTSSSSAMSCSFVSLAARITPEASRTVTMP